MSETNVFQLSQPGTFADPLTEVLRAGARALLAQAVEARPRPCSADTQTRRPMMAAIGSCAMVICRSVRL